MNSKYFTISHCLALAVLSVSVQTTQADTLKKNEGSRKSLQSRIHSLENKCAEKSRRNPYVTYRMDLKTMKCVAKSITNKPHCSDGYYLFKKKCIKGVKP